MQEVRAPLPEEPMQAAMEKKQRLNNEVLRGEQRGEQQDPPLGTSMQPTRAPARQVEVWCDGKVIEWTASEDSPIYKGLPPLYQP